MADPLSTSADAHQGGISIVEIANALLARWRMIAILVVAGAALGVALAFLLPQEFTATTLFVPEESRQSQLPGALSGLATQFGIALPVEPSQSPRFYVSLARSRELMDSVLLTAFPLPQAAPGDSAKRLLDLLSVRGRDRADSLANGRKELDKRLATRVDDETNIVTLSVRLARPRLAAAVANAFVARIDGFNAETRTSRARQRRLFVEQRLDQQRERLQEAEDGLEQFYVHNRLWQQSPELVAEEGRLQRRVQVQQEVFLTLSREYEDARIQEVNNIPVITVIEQAVPPARRSQPNRRVVVVVAVVLFGLVGVTGALGAEYLDHIAASGDPHLDRFLTLTHGASRDIRQVAARLIPWMWPRRT
jgi:uncharacterized protein involved in exopolysaccharide biosynthesis